MIVIVIVRAPSRALNTILKIIYSLKYITNTRIIIKNNNSNISHKEFYRKREQMKLARQSATRDKIHDAQSDGFTQHIKITIFVYTKIPIFHIYSQAIT